MARTSRTAKPAVEKARGADRRRTTRLAVAPSRKAHVFISYRREDKAIAVELRESILNVNRDRIECLLDCEVIDQGKLFLDRINEELKRADWLVCIYTGVQSTYCGYEVGVFENARAGSRRSRLVALYDVQDEALPGLFDRYENAPIRYLPERGTPDGASDEDAFYEKTDIARFFRNLCAYDGL